MNILKLSLIILSVTTLYAQEYTITKVAPFNPLLVGAYKLCENNATNLIKEEAIINYIGCKSENSYDISVLEMKQGKRNITLSECSIETTVDVKSDILETNKYLLGKNGAICNKFDTKLVENNKRWSSFEIGIYYALSNKQEKLEMSGSDSKTYFSYDKVPMYGLNLSYLYKIVDSQYIGLKAYYMKAFETFTDTTTTGKNREDGNPSISRVGGGISYGYRYKLQTELSATLNFYKESVTSRLGHFHTILKVI